MAEGALAASKVISAILLYLLFTATVCAAGPKDGARRHALENLSNPEIQLRRKALADLGKFGLPVDETVLLTALHDPDLPSAKLAESALWDVWNRSGDKQVDAMLNRGMEHMRDGRFTLSIKQFSKAIKRKPDFAEAWNKRAIAYFLMGDYRRALQDCDEVMKRNPNHFGALTGYGNIYLRLNEPRRALQYLERALDINPNLEEVSELMDQIADQLQEDGSGSI